MARAYSDDLREGVAAAVLSGRPGREVAATFGVSVASALKWSQRGCRVSPNTVWSLLRKAGHSLKKRMARPVCKGDFEVF